MALLLYHSARFFYSYRWVPDQVWECKCLALLHQSLRYVNSCSCEYSTVNVICTVITSFQIHDSAYAFKVIVCREWQLFRSENSKHLVKDKEACQHEAISSFTASTGREGASNRTLEKDQTANVWECCVENVFLSQQCHLEIWSVCF